MMAYINCRIFEIEEGTLELQTAERMTYIEKVNNSNSIPVFLKGAPSFLITNADISQPKKTGATIISAILITEPAISTTEYSSDRMERAMEKSKYPHNGLMTEKNKTIIPMIAKGAKIARSSIPNNRIIPAVPKQTRGIRKIIK